jgi:osmotically-inducible protein OsmY
LRPEDIRNELSEQGKALRRKARDIGEAASDAALDTRTTTVIKAKLAADPDLSALSISVATTGGRVTLSGTVA